MQHKADASLCHCTECSIHGAVDTLTSCPHVPDGGACRDCREQATERILVAMASYREDMAFYRRDVDRFRAVLLSESHAVHRYGRLASLWKTVAKKTRVVDAEIVAQLAQIAAFYRRRSFLWKRLSSRLRARAREAQHHADREHKSATRWRAATATLATRRAVNH